MKSGFIDWTEGLINLYVFDGQTHDDTLSIEVEGGLNSSSLAQLLKPGLEQIYISVPHSSLSLRELTFPFSDRTKINDIISYELEGLLLGGVGDYAIDHIITETSGSGCKALAACIEKTKLAEIIGVFSSAGLEPRVVTSLDLRLAAGNIARLVEGLQHDGDARIRAAREELMAPSINLRKDEFAYTGDTERMKKALRVTASLLLLLGLIFCAYTALELTARKKENRALSGELQNVYRNVFPEDRKIVDPVKQFRGNLNLLREKKAVFGGVPVLDILNDIAGPGKNNVVLYEFSADGKNLIVKGTASSFEEVDSLKNSLSASFEGVKVTGSDSTADKKINFSILMQEKNP
ncbi:MAG: hypothetical protein HZA16_08960 [Nitrospirae bacterium]|nr:hypothetical protein [Nitrospirota bacterium]